VFRACRLIYRLLDGLLGASFLMLTLVTPMQTSPRRQRLQIYLWSGVIFVVFSILISLFRVKNRGAWLISVGHLVPNAVFRLPLQAPPLMQFDVRSTSNTMPCLLYLACFHMCAKKTPMHVTANTMIRAGKRTAQSREGKYRWTGLPSSMSGCQLGLSCASSWPYRTRYGP
jgi:hypothetical protein